MVATSNSSGSIFAKLSERAALSGHSRLAAAWGRIYALLRPRDPQAWLVYQRPYKTGGDLRSAETILRRGLAAVPESQLLALELLSTLADAGDVAGTVDLLAERAARSPESAEVSLGSVIVCLRRGQVSDATEWALETERRSDLRNPEDQHILMRLAALILGHISREWAQKIFVDLTRSEFQHPAAFIYAGLLTETEDADEANRLMTEARRNWWGNEASFQRYVEHTRDLLSSPSHTSN